MANQAYLLYQLNKALLLMTSRLDQEQQVSLDELAEAAAFSKYHFHRIYRLLLGETCQQTQLRLKLAKAGQALSSAQNSVTEAALQAGFTSSQSLAKALQRELGCNATALRADPDWLSAVLEELARPLELTASPYQVTLVSLAPCTLVSITTLGQYPELDTTYAALFDQLAEQTEIQAILGLAYQDTDSDVLARFDCALLVMPVPEQLDSRFQLQQLDAQQYLVFRHTGSYQHLSDSIDWLYLYCVQHSRYWPADRPCLHHYLDDPEQVDEALLRTDIYLPVTEKETAVLL
jgi:AraC family transcriptional regulator